ncbi:pimeloyl-ACP methyl ester carboxylesterase [Fluviicoccus keumensis]|uniref:Pimeloyl-ACP methyl ester carboxylesterase n=1 Tax=Fluviicoccus keumensis TaxID=1435465 RepID=A0A4Q7YJ72_9GAMM|nr:alpha/beta hydrolase [Fluviicoccus keumensis]RZU36874.1 pimeloyl-ACP methyl ester carboxylesterase [Fluviicoccus keumensis]
MPFIRVRDGQSLYVRIVGRGQPVLMLPGLGMHSAHWLPFILPYLGRFRFYLPDFRGHGKSAGVRLNQTDVFHNHMEDVQDLIAGLHLHDFLLAGISLGGSTALHLNREAGLHGVRRYLHIDQSPCVANRSDWSHGLFGLRQDELFGQMHRLGDLLDEHAGLTHLGELPPVARREAAATLAEVAVAMSGKPLLKPLVRQLLASPGQLSKRLPLTRLDDCRAYLRAYTVGSHDYRQALRQCALPVTVMVGMKSPLYAPAGQMAIADYAPNARIVRFHKSGHAPMVDEPLKFIRELGRFLHG